MGTVSTKGNEDLDQARRARAVDVARVAVLGMNAWLVALVLPALLAAPAGAGAFVAATVPLLPLGAGILLLGRTRAVATWILLGGFPAAVAAAAAALPSLVLKEPYSPLGLVLAVLSLLAFAAASALAGSRPEALRATTQRPLGVVNPAEEDVPRHRLQSALIGVAGAGAMAIAVIAPGAGSDAAFREAWGDSASEAAVLTTVVAGAIAAAILALFVAPAMRASRKRPPGQRQVRLRVSAFMLVVVTGMLVWFLMNR